MQDVTAECVQATGSASASDDRLSQTHLEADEAKEKAEKEDEAHGNSAFAWPAEAWCVSLSTWSPAGRC